MVIYIGSNRDLHNVCLNILVDEVKLGNRCWYLLRLCPLKLEKQLLVNTSLGIKQISGGFGAMVQCVAIGICFLCAWQ